jgi:mono/diheme cytochrome c family protein
MSLSGPLFRFGLARWATGWSSALRVSGGLMLAAGVTQAHAATPTVPTYTSDVANIFYKNCVRCHRQDGAVARIPLDTYETVKLEVGKVYEKVKTGAMPPWPADSAQSLPMKNDPRMTPQDIREILDWIDAGAPKGADADIPQPVYKGGWLHPDNRPPDWVASLPKFTVPPNGTVPYLRQLIKVPYLDDKWISSLQVRAGNTVLLHHMGVTEVALPEGVTPETLDAMDTLAAEIGAPSAALELQQPVVADLINPGSYDMLGVSTPGTTFESYGEGNGKLLKGGENVYLNFNIHYTTTGHVETDQTQLAVWFQSTPPDHVLYRAPTAVASILANGRELLTDDPGTQAEGTSYAIPPIPANGRNYELIGMTTYRSPITIYQLQPHAHVRAVDFRYTVIYPDGREQVILTVPHYGYHHQLEYALATPLALPAGSKIIVRAHYDNSTNNDHLSDLGANDAARRCGPENVAFFGQQNQSWDEMFTPFIQYSADEPPAKRLDLVSAVGCLAHEPSGQWRLVHGSEAISTSTQGTSSTELATSSAVPFGGRQYKLLGIDVFNPAKRVGNKVVSKGVLIPTPEGDRINVTSLQSTQSSCPE